MTTQLRAVLDAFEGKHTAVSLNQLSRELGVTPAILDSMIDFWVRKGRLREAATPTTCGSCGHAQSCPFIMKMPRMIELVKPDEPPMDDPPCACCG
jgi:hypothetical protein